MVAGIWVLQSVPGGGSAMAGARIKKEVFRA